VLKVAIKNNLEVEKKKKERKNIVECKKGRKIPKKIKLVKLHEK
jgi:hypothetical protein